MSIHNQTGAEASKWVREMQQRKFNRQALREAKAEATHKTTFYNHKDQEVTGYATITKYREFWEEHGFERSSIETEFEFCGAWILETGERVGMTQRQIDYATWTNIREGAEEQ